MVVLTIKARCRGQKSLLASTRRFGYRSVFSSQMLCYCLHAYRYVPGSLAELMGDPDGAIYAYEQALRHNQWSVPAMNAISQIYRAREKFPQAMEYLRSILKLEPTNGEVWGSLGTNL